MTFEKSGAIIKNADALRILKISVLLLASLTAGYATEPIFSTEKASLDSAYEEIPPPKHGTKQIFKYPDGPLYQILKPNLDTYVDDWGTPPYRVVTNSRGIRNEEFETDKPENTTRVLIIGDSYAFGWGVNRSDRFSNLLEKKLNEESENTYQVINSGVPGYGMEDYFLYLKHRGLKYNPDIVVVNFGPNDWLSRERWDETIKKAHKQVFDDINRSEATRKEIRKNIGYRETEIRHKMFDKMESTQLDTFAYMSKMESVSNEENFELMFYSYSSFDWMPYSDKTYDSIHNWEQNHSSKVIWAPEKFEELPREKYTLSKADTHYNAKGHQIMADKLYREGFKQYSSKSKNNDVLSGSFSLSFIGN